MMDSKIKHALHCCFFISIIIFAEVFTGRAYLGEFSSTSSKINPWEQYGVVYTILLYILRFLVFLSLPQVLFNFFGLTLYNAFPDGIQIKGSPILAPFICIRVVTRGDYPNLVRRNVVRNLARCTNAGLKNFMIEVVTDKPIGITPHRRVREIVVPSTYHTKTGALFKARALQYCLEEDVNVLNDSDWVVHLDEETLLTDNSVRGIRNFVLDGKHPFGQGLITYANEDVVNWITTLADSIRVADDMGKLRLQFTMFHLPLFSWKGSYVVAQLGAEKSVSFDNGPDGSIAEDCFFAMRAFKEGYTFNFIEGEMWEKSPSSVLDFLQQRKRWMQGILLVVHSRVIPIRHKLLLALSCYSCVTMPLSTSNVMLAALFPIPCPPLIDFLSVFIAAVSIYMYIFGVIKSLSLNRFGTIRCMLCIIGTLCTIPLNVLIENVAVIWGLCSPKYRFYVVSKEISTTMTV
ncbi:hypothetical protein B566_EDAN016584 [Ephemera danica]|nr:hypothetical protein B566_EDAN016584 [Ephemera danica]